MYRVTITIILLFISLPSFSHAGHDHSHPMANVIHLLWVAPLVIVAVFLINKLLKRHKLLNNK